MPFSDQQINLRAKHCTTQHRRIFLNYIYTDFESADLYKANRADLIRACRHANRELRKHKLYLDQLLTIVIDRHPEILSLVTEAQKMRLLQQAYSY